MTMNNTHGRENSKSPAAFEPQIPGSEQPQTHALDRAATMFCRNQLEMV